jgi:hypothetical protein
VVDGVIYMEETIVVDKEVVSVVNMKDVEPEVIVVVSGMTEESTLEDKVLVTVTSVTLALDEVSAASLMEIASLLSVPPTCCV